MLNRDSAWQRTSGEKVQASDKKVRASTEEHALSCNPFHGVEVDPDTDW